MALFARSPAWDEIELWALDLETSGLDPRRDQILSMGMIPIRQGAIQWGDHDYTLVRPRSLEGLAGEAVGIHQLLPEELQDAPSLEEVMGRIERHLRGAALIVHHAPTDVEFLRSGFRAAGMTWPGPPVIDTRVLVELMERRMRRLEPFGRPLPRALADLCAHFGLPAFDTHHALADALATAQLFLALRARLGARTLRHLRAR